MQRYSRRKFLHAFGAGGLLLPALVQAGLITTAGARCFNCTPPAGPTGLQFPNMSPGYQSAIPGLAGHGFDSPVGSGRGTSNQVAKTYIDDLGTSNTGSARPELGPRSYSGTFEYCWRLNTFLADGTSPMSKSIIPLIPGWVHGAANIPMQTGTPPRGGFVNYLGQYEPPPGLWLRGMRPHLNGASDCMVMHMHSFIGDDDGGLGADNRDPFGSGYSGGTVERLLLLFNEFGFSVDEILDGYWGHHLVSVIGNFFGPALMDSRIDHAGDPVDEPHGFGPYFGGGAQMGSLTWTRNKHGHAMGRNPMTSARLLAFANNMFYNIGARPGGGTSEGLDIIGAGFPDARIADIVHNWFIRGPEHTSTPVAVRLRSGSGDDAGCQGYLGGNAAHGWTMANQAAFLNSGIPTYLQGALVGALPGSWGAGGGMAAVLQETPSTTAEWLAVLDLMEKYTGAGRRLAGTPQPRVFQQARDRINGGSTSFQFVDTVQEWTGNGTIGAPYWAVSGSAINPLDPGSAWVGPMPTGADVDTPIAGGTFSNGMSADNRSLFERHYIEQHYKIMRERGITV